MGLSIFLKVFAKTRNIFVNEKLKAHNGYVLLLLRVHNLK